LFSMRQPPSPTPFPYTTLFRSVLHVPMKGAPDALTEVLTGRADFYFALPFQVGPQIKEGKLRALAVGSPKRSALFPDVPTTVERSEEHTSELQSRVDLVCRLLL